MLIIVLEALVVALLVIPMAIVAIYFKSCWDVPIENVEEEIMVRENYSSAKSTFVLIIFSMTWHSLGTLHYYCNELD